MMNQISLLKWLGSPLSNWGSYPIIAHYSSGMPSNIILHRFCIILSSVIVRFFFNFSFTLSTFYFSCTPFKKKHFQTFQFMIMLVYNKEDYIDIETFPSILYLKNNFTLSRCWQKFLLHPALQPFIPKEAHRGL